MFKSKQEINSTFSAFRNSKDGQIEQTVIWEELQKHLRLQGGENILDASCGEGWLSRKLINLSPNVFAFDISEKLVNEAKAKNSKINFSVADIEKPLPYEDNFFDLIFWNLGAHDILELSPVYKNFSNSLKPDGSLFVVVANPYYSFPVGEWKRGIKKFLPGSKPMLKLNPYNWFKKNRPFSWGQNIRAYFHTLPEINNPCLAQGLKLENIEEIISGQDSKQFNRAFQLYRFPMLMLLTFKKTLK